MTISRQELQAPTDLPTVRLYLDDIEEISRVLFEIVANAKRLSLDEKDEPVQTEFLIGDQTCTEARELPDVATSTRKLEVKVSRPHWTRVTVSIDSIPSWRAFGLTNDEEWVAFRRLQPIFEARELRWRSVLRRPLSGVVVGIFSPLLFFTILTEVLRKGLPARLAGGLAISVVALLFFIFARVSFKGSEVIFRKSSEHAAIREERFWRVVPAILSGFIGLLVGIAITYLKHKYWP